MRLIKWINKKLHLIVSSTYGTMTISPQNIDGQWLFRLPSVLTKRAGVVEVILKQNKTIVYSITLKFVPDIENLGDIETYLGPRDFIANPRDYTMLVSIPTIYL